MRLLLLLSLTVPYSPLYPIGELIDSALPSATQITWSCVIPADTTEITEITVLAVEKGDTDFGQKPKLEPIEVFGVGKWTKKLLEQRPPNLSHRLTDAILIFDKCDSDVPFPVVAESRAGRDADFSFIKQLHREIH